MQATIRPYQKSDYQFCEALVNEAWNFDGIFAPQALADFAKYIYTQGSVVGSNHQRVIEIEGKVVGLLFGYNEKGSKTKSSLFHGLKLLWRLLWVKCEKPVGKKALFKAMVTHMENRLKIVPKRQSEIVLFVIAKAHQRQGYGQQLWAGFKEACTQSAISSIVVETNKSEASSFYERIGFEHLGDFDSPLHAFATKDGQACMYEYVIEADQEEYWSDWSEND